MRQRTKTRMVTIWTYRAAVARQRELLHAALREHRMDDALKHARNANLIRERWADRVRHEAEEATL